MGKRVMGMLALVGGGAWIVKILLIWGNGGTNKTDGIVGVFFMLGFVGLMSAAVLKAWSLPTSRRPGPRIVAAVLAFPVLLAMVDLPILVGWQVFGHTWFAGEVGILLTAFVGIALGSRWLGVRSADEAVPASG